MKVIEVSCEMPVYELDKAVQGLDTKAFIHNGKVYGQVDTGTVAREIERSNSATPHDFMIPLPPEARRTIPLYPPTYARWAKVQSWS